MNKKPDQEFAQRPPVVSPLFDEADLFGSPDPLNEEDSMGLRADGPEEKEDWGDEDTGDDDTDEEREDTEQDIAHNLGKLRETEPFRFPDEADPFPPMPDIPNSDTPADRAFDAAMRDRDKGPIEADICDKCKSVRPADGYDLCPKCREDDTRPTVEPKAGPQLTMFEEVPMSKDLPVFLCRTEDDEHELRIPAVDEQHAAEEFVKRIEWDNASFPVASGNETVNVRVGDTLFEVSGITDPQYSAKKI